MNRAHLAMDGWFVTVVAVLAAVCTSATGSAPPPRGRLLKVPKVYNALITSDIPLLPSRAETAATAAVGPVLLYSTHLPVVLQPQSPGTTPQHHVDKLQQLQNQLQHEEADQHRQAPIHRFQQQLLTDRHPVQQQLERQPVLPVKQLPVQQQLFPDRQLPVRQQLFPQPQVQQQLFPERQPLPPNQPFHLQQIPVQHLSTEQLSDQPLNRQHFDVPYHQKQQYPQVDVQLQQKQLQLQHQKQLLQVHHQKQLELNQFVQQQKVEQDTSYLPMPEMSSYQPPPSVHIDEIKNNKPSNTEIPDVPPPPLPVGKRLQSYSYISPGLSPPPPTNHHVPYG